MAQTNSPNMVSFSATGGAAAITQKMDFMAKCVIVLNATKPSVSLWLPSLGNPGFFKIDDTGAGTVDLSSGTTNGITVKPGSITLGTTIQTTSDALHVLAFR
jgi:hypothetical protein